MKHLVQFLKTRLQGDSLLVRLWQAADGQLEQVKDLESILGYRFCNRELLLEALTHKSGVGYYQKRVGKDPINAYTWNERLEFLGDAVLDLIMAHYFWQRYPKLPEGDLSRIRACIVNEAALAKVGNQLKLDRFLLLGKNTLNQSNKGEAIIADAVEAIIGAIYLDSSLKTTEERVLQFLHHG